MIKSLILFFSLIISATVVVAQQGDIDKLIKMLNWSAKQIDTTLKKQGYILMQKEVDSVSALYQYSFLDRKEEQPTTLRSLAYMDVQAGELKSRLITYRTYSKEEFQQLSSYLLSHNYQATEKYDFGESKHTVYSNGTQSIRVKVTTTVLKGGKKFVVYELELGK